MRIKPRHVDTNLKLCVEYVFLGRKAEALQQYETLKSLSPQQARQIAGMFGK